VANTGSISWRIIGAAQTVEGGVPSYTVSYTGTPITDPVTIQLDPIFPGGLGAANPEGGGGANPADYDGTFAAAVAAAIAALPPGSGITFNAATYELTFAPGGATSFTFSIGIVQDNAPEGSESYLVRVQNQSFGVVEPGFDGALTSITDNNGFAPGERLWSITGDYAAVEGGEAPRFTVTLSGEALAPGAVASVSLLPQFQSGLNLAGAADFVQAFAADVQAAIAALPPGSGVSYDSGTGLLSFTGGGLTSFEFRLPTAADATFEGDEIYLVNLSGASAGTAVAANAESVFSIIVDHDAVPPSVEWLIAGTQLVPEGGVPTYTVKWKGPALDAGETVSIQLGIDLPNSATGAYLSDFENVFTTDILAAIAALPPGTAISYDDATRTLTFGPGAPQEFTFSLPTLDDLVREDVEAFAVTLLNPSEGHIIETLGGIVTRITDNEPPPSVTIGDAQASEGQPLVFDVSLSHTSTTPITLEFLASSGTAAGGVDFETTSFEVSLDGGATWSPAGGPDGRHVTFPAFITDIQVRIATTDDTIDEPGETMTLSVSSVVDGSVGNTSDTGTGTILDNDPPPSVVIGGAQVTEGQALVFDVTLSNASSSAITLQLAANSGTATAGTDFESFPFEVSTDGGISWVDAGGINARDITFAPGQTALKVRVDTTDDQIFEGTETMSLSVESVIAGTIGPTTPGTGTILDNETPPNVTISDAQATEGQPLVFDVSLSNASALPIVLELLAASGSALAGTDFESIGFEVSTDGGLTWLNAGGATGREVTFAAGQTTLKVRIDTTDDAVFEGTETMNLSVSNVVAGPTGTTSDTGTGTILDSDAAPIVTISDAQSTEGQPLVFDVSLSNASATPITLELLAASGTATAGTDFETAGFQVSTDGGITWVDAGGATGREVTFAPGTSALKVRVDTTDDVISESAETMAVSVSSVVAGTVGNSADTGTGTILENDAAPSVTIGDAQATEGQPLVFDVNLSNASSGPITLELAALGGTAAAGTDFESAGFQVSTDGGATWVDAGGATGREITFAAGQTTLKVRVDTTDDALFEGGETMSLAVSNVVAGSVGSTTDTGAGTILDNDPVPSVTIGDAQATEGQPLVFEVTLSNASASTITLRLAGNSGTADAGTDFETSGFQVSTDGGVTWVDAGGPNGRDVTFAAGQTTLKVRVDTTDDQISEGTETMSLAVEGVVEGNVLGIADTGAGTILDGDPAPSVTIGDAQAAEGQPLVFDVTLTGTSSDPITLELLAGNGTAQGGVDFETAGFQVSTDGGVTWVNAGGATGREVTFAPGTTALKVRVDTTDDTDDENDETMTLSVSNVVAGTVGTFAGTGTGTITDNDEGTCRLLINEIGLGVATTPSGEKCASYIEIINAGSGTCTAAELACHRLKIEGPCGNDSVVKFGSFHPAVSLPPGAFLVVYENGEFKTVDASGTLLAKGTWDCDGGWDLGSTVADEIAVNLFLKSGESIDAFFANGFDPRGFRGADFKELDAPKGAAKMAHKAGVDGDLLDHEGFNGQLGDPKAVMDALGLDRDIERWALKNAAPMKVFARVFGPGDGIDPDTNSAADWTVSNAATDGTLNAAPNDLNPRDPADDLDPRQGTGTNGATAGQTVLDAATAGVVLVGKNGPDFLYGDQRDNDIRGGAHNDFAVGGDGNDHIRGDAGADLLVDLNGRDAIAGGSGDDIILATQHDGKGPKTTGGDVLIGDTIAAVGDPAADNGRDVVIGGELVDIVFGDTLVLDPANSSTAFDLPVEQLAALLKAKLATASGAEYDAVLHALQHSAGAADRIETNGGNDIVFGQGGDDVIKAGDGDDLVYGGDGKDEIHGENGKDILVGGAGADVIKAGAGDDVIHADGEDTVNGGAGKDTLALTMGGVLDLDGRKLESIEQIDLRGGADLTLKLDFKDILSMSGSGRLTVLGEAGDHLTLDLSGHKVSTHTSGGFVVHVIDNGAAVLKVNADLQHNVIGV
jgi:Ca2+-binding RTX toxin-like protein